MTWFQFNHSGFFFRIDGRVKQGAMIISITDEISLGVCGIVSAQTYYLSRPHLFHRPTDEYLEVLNRIPIELAGVDDYKWALETIAD